MFTKLALIAVAGLIAAPAIAAPGFVALEGSDATSLHHDTQYSTQLFSYLKGSSLLPVLVYNQSGPIDIDASTGQTNTYVNSLVGVTLSNFSAIYIQTPGGCCSADNSVLNGFGASVGTFISGGGNLSIGNYNGGTYDGIVVGGAAPAGSIGGIGGNGATGPGCTDLETVTAAGIAKGFTQPPVLGCWSHQGYQSSYWEPLGYLNLIASSTEYTYADGTHLGSSFLAIGGSLGTPGIPEPASWALMITGFVLVGGVMRRRVTRVAYS